jgi:hypothetical protein
MITQYTLVEWDSWKREGDDSARWDVLTWGELAAEQSEMDCGQWVAEIETALNIAGFFMEAGFNTPDVFIRIKQDVPAVLTVENARAYIDSLYRGWTGDAPAGWEIGEGAFVTHGGAPMLDIVATLSWPDTDKRDVCAWTIWIEETPNGARIHGEC